MNSCLKILTYLSKIEKLTKEDVFYHSLYKKEIPKLREQGLHEQHEVIIDGSESWFDKLPDPIKHKIFSIIDHFSLIKFSMAYPCYQNTIVRSCYWKNLDLLIGKDILSWNELIEIVTNLKEQLKTFKINLCKYEERVNFEHIQNLFNNLSNLKSLCVAFNSDKIDFVNTICLNVNNLKELDIECYYLTNQHLIKIADSLLYLDSVRIFCRRDLNAGFKYLIRKVKRLKVFDILTETVDDETIELLASKHRNWLTELILMVNEPKNGDKIFNILKSFANLKKLIIDMIIIPIDVSLALDHLNLIQCLKLHNCMLDTTSICQMIINKSKVCLERISLKNVYISRKCFELIAKNCPNLKTLLLYNCNLSDESLINGFKYMNNLKNLRVSQTQSVDGVTSYDFLNLIPNEILPSLANLCVVTQFLYYDLLKDKLMLCLNNIKAKKDINTILFEEYS